MTKRGKRVIKEGGKKSFEMFDFFKGRIDG